jgi:hypothetical protein
MISPVTAKATIKKNKTSNTVLAAFSGMNGRGNFPIASELMI